MDDFKGLPLKGKMVYGDIVEKLDMLGAVPNGIYDDFVPETNGWQVDYWLYFILNDTEYVLSGSMWHGDYTITKDE